MAVLGNTVAGGASLSLTPQDCFGHFDPTRQVLMGNPIPAAIVRTWWVYMAGPGVPNVSSTVQFALYDSSGGAPPAYPLVITSPSFLCVTGSPAAWRSVADSQVVAAGTYCIAILANSISPFTGSVYFTAKPAGADIRTFIVPGTFPNPLGGPPTSGNSEWSMYIDYDPATDQGAPPGAACFCQPKCGAGQ